MSLTSRQFDEMIESALFSVSQTLRSSADESFAAQGDGLAMSERLWELVDEGAVTSDGVKLTRDEFRRRLESERARHAGQAERLRLEDACERLEQIVLGYRFEPLIEGSIDAHVVSLY